jgi:ABC-type multidrug transport system ATPase subunit
MGTLSIRENLYFSAALRLPSKMSHKERKMRVDKVVQELGLENVQNSKVNIIILCHKQMITISRTTKRGGSC